MILSETATRRLFGSDDPIGRFITSATAAGSRFEVVGVVGDVRRNGLATTAPPQAYRPLEQRPTAFATLMVRTTLPPNALAKSLAATLANVTSLTTRLALLQGLRDGLAGLGRRETSPPKNWDSASAALLATGDAKLRDLLTQVSQLLGDAKASASQLAILQDRTAPVERRRDILRGFARDAYVESLPTTLSLLDEAPLRRDAIRALAAFDDPRVARNLLSRYAALSAADKA